ncbi:MAG: hypothetical protein JNM24_08630 [Bdellovibrionaceae bacterium]|mgnify:FL=1|nr:hypothetical protein [Pseudobdellovibrionaceae bacterium]
MKIKREFEIPIKLEVAINENLGAYGLSLSESKRIAAAIQWQSDFYINNPNQQTPWKEQRAQIAQWAYYLPLNFLRNLAVLNELKTLVPFDQLEAAFDYGAGLGASSWALRQAGFKGKITMFDRQTPPPAAAAAVTADFVSQFEPRNYRNQLGIFSYSLTEIPNRNDLLNQFSQVVIIEPSTQTEGRRLSETRKFLIENDFDILAPCTHQGACPLIVHSQKDWCHDRILFKKPTWMDKIEKNLPFRNDSLTFSYLIAFKKGAMKPEWRRSQTRIQARLTGDILPEKGKDKQLVCFDERRLFLTWMHKNKIDQTLPRGGRVEIPDDIEIVANEVRLKKEIQYLP